jgi:hypothetical protein
MGIFSALLKIIISDMPMVAEPSNWIFLTGVGVLQMTPPLGIDLSEIIKVTGFSKKKFFSLYIIDI